MLVQNMEGQWGDLDSYRGLNSTATGATSAGMLGAEYLSPVLIKASMCTGQSATCWHLSRLPTSHAGHMASKPAAKVALVSIVCSSLVGLKGTKQLTLWSLLLMPHCAGMPPCNPLSPAHSPTRPTMLLNHHS